LSTLLPPPCQHQLFDVVELVYQSSVIK
jgi:hypothetical protein